MLTWNDFKILVNSRTPILPIQIISETSGVTPSEGKIHLCVMVDGLLRNDCIIKKYDTATLNDFNTNYRINVNKPLVKKDAAGNEIITYSPYADADNYEADYIGFRGVATAGITSNVSFKIPKDLYFHGLQLILYKQAEEDLVQFQIVDTDNIFGYGAGFIIKQFGTNWNVDTQFNQQDDLCEDFVAKLPKDLYVVVKYTSTGTVDVKVKCNLYTLKKKI